MKAGGKKAQKPTWNKVSAHNYEVYGTLCSKDKFKKLASVKGTSRTFRKLRGKDAYKYYVVAVDTQGKRIAKSAAQHSITGNDSGRKTNAKSVSAKAGKTTLRTGQTTKLKVSVKAAQKGRALLWKGHTSRYQEVVTDAEYPYSSSEAVKVTAGGTVKAVSKGQARIFVMAANGVRASVVITVK